MREVTYSRTFTPQELGTDNKGICKFIENILDEQLKNKGSLLSLKIEPREIKVMYYED